MRNKIQSKKKKQKILNNITIKAKAKKKQVKIYNRPIFKIFSLTYSVEIFDLYNLNYHHFHHYHH
jgi:hypothetical protein